MKGTGLSAVLAVCIYGCLLSGCETGYTTRLEYDVPVVLKLGRHDFSPRDAAFLKRVSGRTALVMKRHGFRAVKCGELRVPEAYKPITCYTHGKFPIHVILSRYMEANRIRITAIRYGENFAPALSAAMNDLEKELAPFLGKPVKDESRPTPAAPPAAE